MLLLLPEYPNSDLLFARAGRQFSYVDNQLVLLCPFRSLSLLPQVLNHKTHQFVQVVWLKLDCPMDGSDFIQFIL
jgi:hypothetical protein